MLPKTPIRDAFLRDLLALRHDTVRLRKAGNALQCARIAKRPRRLYTTPACAFEILNLLDDLGISRFRLAGHDWGSPIADRICEQAPDRVVQYVRACISVHEYDVRNSLHHFHLHKSVEDGTRLMSKASTYVRVWFDSSCLATTHPPEAEILRLIFEFDRPGVA